MTIFGWDMSHYDWDRGLTAAEIRAAADGGIKFMTHKIGEGTSYIDPNFDDWWRVVKPLRSKVLLGAYHVNWPGAQKPQADRFIALLNAHAPGWKDGPFILQVDSEKFPGMSRPPSAAEIKEFGRRLREKATEHYPVLYAPKWVYGNSLTGVGMPLWASNYGANPKTSYRNAYPGDSSSRWDKYSGQVPALLQYGSETIIAGQRRCDANAFRGTIDQLVKLVYPSGDGDAMAEVPTAKEIVDELLARDMGYSVQRDLSLRTLLLNLHQQGKQPFEDWGQTALLREAINRPQVEAAPVDPAALAAALQDPQTVQAIANAVADTLHARMAE